ncbi:IS200/IS605 family transposase [Paenibacillus thiaminolyticus]|uniref:IS200/IS605 family transposase n=1 Tax=Paenibacillus thiaminolyticus TaxID=49283 RepID=A0A3A3GCF1_PANTH|nr:IS200/IS605 family transposase [Paenibacillus thiaminolyticus]RJG21350.1 IS200/IS605 family transposase [Paenibacillus thiaminolyticus]
MPNKGYDKTNIVSNCSYSVVFCTKLRRRVLESAVEQRLKTLLEEKVSELGEKLLDLQIKSDYVVMEVTCEPRLGIHRMIKQLKAHTSRQLREEFSQLKSRIPSLWTHHYFVKTLGEVKASEVTFYVESQTGL